MLGEEGGQEGGKEWTEGSGDGEERVSRWYDKDGTKWMMRP